MRSLVRVLACLSLSLGIVSAVRVRSAREAPLLIPKVLAGSFAPLVAMTGALSALVGAILGDSLAAIAAGAGALMARRHVCRVTAPHEGFERAFGEDWAGTVPAEQTVCLPGHRWTWRLPDSPEPLWERDVAFWTIPDTDRQLLCDRWQPADEVRRSGLAFVYLHGSAFYLLDKDVGTRTLFRHLAGQGHVVMDVAYRLCPETNLLGMVGDAKRAVAWMKGNAERYGVDAERIVLAGASAGGCVALLAAYTLGDPNLTPDDLGDADASVRGVVSYYGPTDLRAYYDHVAARLLSAMDGVEQPRKPSENGFSARLTRALFGRDIGPMILPSRRRMMRELVGGGPDEVPEMYALGSPISHVGPDCPPTLLIQGEHDFVTPTEGVQALHRKLVEAGVPAVYVELPATEHAFDIAFPRYSPSAQAALYDLDRFLALMAGTGSRRARRLRPQPNQ